MNESSSTKLCECGCGTPVRGRFVSGHNKRKSKVTSELTEHRAHYEAQRPASVPWGFCFCGCGQQTIISKYTDRAKGFAQGEPRRFVSSHRMVKYLDTPEEKLCSTCGESKSVSDFPPSKHHSSGYASQCKVCKGAGDRRYYEANKEKVAKSQRRWYDANREHKREYDRHYNGANREKKREQGRQWQQANKEYKSQYDKQYRTANVDRLRQQAYDWYRSNKAHKQEYDRRYREENFDYIQEATRRWREANPEAWRRNCLQQKIKYRAAKHDAPGDGATLAELIEAHGPLCYLCHEAPATLREHVVPLSRGGTNYASNLRPACHPCNARKHNKTLDEYMEYQSRRTS